MSDDHLLALSSVLGPTERKHFALGFSSANVPGFIKVLKRQQQSDFKRTKYPFPQVGLELDGRLEEEGGGGKRGNNFSLFGVRLFTKTMLHLK